MKKNTQLSIKNKGLFLIVDIQKNMFHDGNIRWVFNDEEVRSTVRPSLWIHTVG